MRWTSVQVSSVLSLHNNEKIPCTALKFRNINWLLQNIGNSFRCRSHDKCVQKYLNLEWNSCMYLCANVHPIRLIFYFLVLLTVSCSPQSFNVRIPSFLSHYWIPVLCWVYDTTVGVMLKFFVSPIRVIMCKHLFRNELRLTIFVLMRSSMCLRYGPCVCNKSLLLFCNKTH